MLLSSPIHIHSLGCQSWLTLTDVCTFVYDAGAPNTEAQTSVVHVNLFAGAGLGLDSL